jgi:hypothetical protein
MRTCSKCKLELPLVKFSLKSKVRGTYSSICKPCHNIYVNLWYKANSSSQKKASSLWKKGNKDRVVATKYKISIEEARTLLEETSCKICGVQEYLHVDHCHTSNKVRGRLCVNCNAGLGHFKDNISLLKKAITYIKDAGIHRGTGGS